MEELFDETKIIGAEEIKENRKISQMKEAQEERARIWADFLAKYPEVVDCYAKRPIKAQQDADYWYEREQEKKREAEEKAIKDELRKREFEESMRKRDEEWESWGREEFWRKEKCDMKRRVEKLNEADFWRDVEEEIDPISLPIVL